MNPIKSLLLCAVLALGLSAKAQTNPLPSSVSDAVTNLFHFVGEGSNFMAAAYGIAGVGAGDNKYGAGVALAYRVSDFVAPVLRLDYYDGRIFMPSGSLQLQLPIAFGKTRLIPFVFTGIATPLTGKGADNDTAVGIFGVGAALRISQHLDLVGDVEKWTSFDGNQIRFGLLWRF